MTIEHRVAGESAPSTIVGRVLEHARRAPDAVALIVGETAYTYAQLARSISALAATLRASGLAPGDRVLVQASSTAGFVVTYLALHAARIIAVPIDAGMPKPRLDFVSGKVAARRIMRELPEPDRDTSQLSSFRSIDAHSSEAEASDVADILFTSGTTGAPKGVMLTHGNLVAAADHINGFIGTRKGDVEVLPLPLAHSFGLGGLRNVLSVGATLVLVDGFAFPGRIFAALEAHRATGFRCVAAGLAMMFKFAPDRLGDFAHQLRYVEIGSAPMASADKLKLMALLPTTRLCMHYGLTEATRSAFIEFHRDRESLGSIGRESSGVEIRVVAENGHVAPVGTPGELTIRGPHVTPGYWGDSERTGAMLADGWLRTGDLGHADERGYLYLVGRKADLINVGGRKVSPAEVEDALRSHASVLDCACSGVVDPAGLSGDAVAVLVLLRDGAQSSRRELREHLRSHLEPYKLPVKWRFSGTIPRTENGKIQRHLLRQQLESQGD